MSFELPEYFDEHTCDGCQVMVTRDQGYYRFLGPVEDCDLCKSCYEKARDLYQEIDDTNYRTCDVCQQYINHKTCWHLGDKYSGMDVCNNCWPTFNPINMVGLIDKDTNKQQPTVFYTERGKLYRYEGRDQLEIPDAIKSRIVDFGLGDLDCVVRPPSYDWNAAKWQYIDQFDDVSHFGAMCGWAVRCEAGQPHQVASVACDNHDRIALNIVYPDVESFLADEKNWKERDQEPKLGPELVDQEYLDECDIEVAYSLIAKSTDSFAVYERLTRKLSLYYG